METESALISLFNFFAPQKTVKERKSSKYFKKRITKKNKEHVQDQFEVLARYWPGAVAVLDKDMRYLIVNDNRSRDYDLEGKDIIGKSHYEVFPQISTMPRWIAYHQRALSGESLSMELDSFAHQGKVIYLRWKLEPWYESDQSIGGIIMFTENLTDQILAQKKLKESERSFRNIFQKAHIGIALVGDGGIPFQVNEPFCKLLEYSSEELIRMSFKEFTHPDDVAKDVALYEKLLAHEIESYTIDKRYITKSGKVKYVRLNVTLVDEGTEHQYALALVSDMTKQEVELEKRKESERKIKELNSLFQEVSHMASIGIWELDTLTNTLYWDDVVYRIHEEKIGKKITLDDAINYYHPDFKEMIARAVKNGIRQKRSWDLELKIITAKGNEKWVRAIGRPVFDQGKVVKLQGLFKDIDIRKNYELGLLSSKKELERLVNQRTLDLKIANEELEAFSYSVSHDLRAPLRAINGFSEALMEDYGKELPESANRYLQRIAFNSQKMGALIDDLLEFSRMNRKQINHEPIDLNEMVAGIMDELFAESKRMVHIKELPTIQGDREMIGQVFTNLLSNAIKYSSKEKNPKIVVSGQEEPESFIISVKDNGRGFNMQYYEKLFQVFQRLHSDSEFEGTGVGLSLCAKIMKAHQGEIWAESEEGAGATFYLKFKKS